MSIRAQSTFTRRSARIPYRRPSQTSSQGDEPVANEAQDAPALEAVVEQEQQTGYQQADAEMGTAEVNTDGGAMNDDNNSLYDENGKVHFRKIFRERKRPSVRAKEKRLRQNRQLRRTLLPKTALMALHELKTLAISDFSFTQHIPGGFTAHVTVNGKQFDGNGSSKMIAKNAACEAALRDFVIAKMIERPRMRKRQKMSSTSESSKMGDEPQSTNSTIENEDLCNTDSQQSGATNNQDDADELPMLNIASFALYKLFSDWEREGYIVPELHPNTEPASEENNTNGEEPAAPAAPKEPKKPTIRTELPANWETMHPATLLCMMRPGLLYTDFGSSGTKNEIVHSMGVTVDGVEYAESGRSKKIARRNVAVSVCNALFGTNFVKEE